MDLKDLKDGEDYRRDDVLDLSECFREDYKLTRLDRVWRRLQKERPCDVKALLQLLEASYEAFLSAYAFEPLVFSFFEKGDVRCILDCKGASEALKRWHLRAFRKPKGLGFMKKLHENFMRFAR